MIKLAIAGYGNLGRGIEKAIRQKLRLYADGIGLLSRRNQILMQLICYAPWLFRMAFRTYVQIVLKGHYE